MPPVNTTKSSHEKRQTFIGLLLIFVTGFILIYHLNYLRNANDAFLPRPNKVLWVAAKRSIIVFWLGIVITLIAKSRAMLKAKGHKVNSLTLLHLTVAGFIFCLSVVFYNPPLIDKEFQCPELTFYFFINSLSYLLLAYALSRMDILAPYFMNIGRCFSFFFHFRAAFYVIPAMIWMFAMSCYLSKIFFQHIPWIDDSIVQFVQAKFLLHGHLYGASPPFPEFFPMKFMVNDGKWYSQYPPGHMILLAIGHWFQNPELINPLLGALTGMAVYFLAKEVYGKHVAKIAIILAALCAYIIIFSSEYMNDATSLLTGTIFLWGYYRILHKPREMPAAVIAGNALGYCFITRPDAAFALALPAGIYALYLMVRQTKNYLYPFLAIGGLFSCYVIFQLYYNHITTGDALMFGYQKVHGIGYNPFAKETIANTFSAQYLYDNLVFNHQRANYFNRILFEWPIPSMALVALTLGLRSKHRDDRLLLATIVWAFASRMFFLTKHDIGWGPRYLYEIDGILLVLCAKGLTLLPTLFRTLARHRRPLSYYYGFGAVMLLSFYLFSFQYNLQPSTIKNFYWLNNREGDPEYYKYIMRNVTSPALVFIPLYKYKYVSFNNPPEDTDPVIFIVDRGNENQKLMALYPNRNIYVFGNSQNSSSLVKIK
jgi:4-amino-4-deoxy-L-arabinose transferase-like glycosyltransferase